MTIGYFKDGGGKDKKTIMKRYITYIILCLVLAISLSACESEKRNYRAHMDIDYKTDADGNTVLIMNGTESNTFEVKDKPESVYFSIERKSGSIDILIYLENDSNNYIYEGHDIQLNEFSVTVSETGRYDIYITCDDFIGDYKVSYTINMYE